jgi:hypothetical protein
LPFAFGYGSFIPPKSSGIFEQIGGLSNAKEDTP